MMNNSAGYQLPKILKGTILEQIMETKLHEIRGAKEKLPASSLRMALEKAPEVRSLKDALRRNRPAIIAEIKRASPSAGALRTDFDALGIGRQYQEAGAAALSVLTEVHHFKGNLEILASIRWETRIPLLRKDFLVDPYQLLEARHAGADAVLLIAALLDKPSLKRLHQEAESLGMEVLVEVHDEWEMERALEAGATLIGVNSRDLLSFEVAEDVFFRLGSRLPADIFAVAESGIREAEGIWRLLRVGYVGFLIGEHFMRAPSPGLALSELLSACSQFVQRAS